VTKVYVSVFMESDVVNLICKVFGNMQSLERFNYE
jgi:hypothetical protein